MSSIRRREQKEKTYLLSIMPAIMLIFYLYNPILKYIVTKKKFARRYITVKRIANCLFVFVIEAFHTLLCSSINCYDYTRFRDALILTNRGFKLVWNSVWILIIQRVTLTMRSQMQINRMNIHQSFIWEIGLNASLISARI